MTEKSKDARIFQIEMEIGTFMGRGQLMQHDEQQRVMKHISELKREYQSLTGKEYDDGRQSSRED